jgi:hypothetical protein
MKHVFLLNADDLEAGVCLWQDELGTFHDERSHSGNGRDKAQERGKEGDAELNSHDTMIS